MRFYSFEIAVEQEPSDGGYGYRVLQNETLGRVEEWTIGVP